MNLQHSDCTRRLVSFHGVAALSFTIYDNILTFDDEVSIIWPKPKGSWLKWQFLFSRYCCFFVQLVNSCISIMVSNRVRMSSTPLKTWFMCQVVLNMVFMTSVEFVLMARVYALYNRSRVVGGIFCMVLLGKTGATIAGVVLNWPDVFEAHSWLDTTPDSFAYFGFASVVSQIIIISLTFWRYVKVKSRFSMFPVVALILRDGTATFIPIFLTCLVTSIFAVLSSPYAPIGDFWFLSIVSTAGCRVIINMHHQALEEYYCATNNSNALNPLTTFQTEQSDNYPTSWSS